jgi:hypothetical protein
MHDAGIGARYGISLLALHFEQVQVDLQAESNAAIAA